MSNSPEHPLSQLAKRVAFVVAVAVSPLAIAAQDDYVDSSVHYDQVFRVRALAAHQAGDAKSAARHFERAARYADKPSQFALGVMYMQGDGVPLDRPRAYAWFDVAAERGYAEVLVQREHLWSELDAAERREALSIARRLHARYGDTRAKRRHLNKTQAALTHSLGKSKSLREDVVVSDVHNCSAGTIDFTRGGPCGERGFFVARFDPDVYWAGQDAAWGVDKGVVEVGALRRPR